MNVQSRVFPSVTDEWPFQDHLLSKTIISTCQTLPPWRFPSVTDEQPFQDQLMSKTIIKTFSALSLCLSIGWSICDSTSTFSWVAQVH